MRPQVTVVVVSKDEPELSTTLDALRAECEALGAACVVVDASRGRLDDIWKDHPWVEWVPYEPVGAATTTIAHQRNQGMAAARTEVVAFCDAGGLPVAGWLERLTLPLVDGRAMAATGPIYPSRPGAYGLLNDYEDGTWVHRVITSNFAVTKTAWSRVGGFDERYAYGSDAVLGWRLADVGVRTLVVREAGMVVDWGDARRERARAWRQGRAWGRQLVLFGSRPLRTARAAPYTLLYAFAIAVLASAVGVRQGPRRTARLALALAALAALVVGGRPREARLRVATYHLIHGAGAVTELACVAVRGVGTPR